MGLPLALLVPAHEYARMGIAYTNERLLNMVRGA